MTLVLTELILNGLVQGSLLALICIGYSLAYGTARVINFAHADVMIAGGGYLVILWTAGEQPPRIAPVGTALLFGVAFCVVAGLFARQGSLFNRRSLLMIAIAGTSAAFVTFLLVGKLPFMAAALLAAPWTACLASAIYTAGYLPLIRREAPRTSVLVASLGLSIAIESYLLVLWGSERRVFSVATLPQALVPRAVPADSGIWEAIWHYGLVPLGAGIVIPVHDVLIVATFVVVVGALVIFFRLSRTADAIVATADARLAARACGVPVDKVVGYAFFLGGAIASLAGTLFVLRAKSLDPQTGFSPGIIAFVACVLGGIGSLRGSVVGAFLVAMATSLAPAVPLESWFRSILPETTIRWLPSLNLSNWSYGVVYVLMIVTILFKPRGLFAR